MKSIPARRVFAVLAALACALIGLVGVANAATPTNPLTAKDYVSACPPMPAPGKSTCLALQRTNVASHFGISPNQTPSGYGPSDLQSAYNLTSAGSGATVAVVDVYDDTTAESDLATYRSQYGLPACTTANGCFSQVNQNLQTSPLPQADNSWATETSLDLDAVSAICPACHIVLVEASSENNSDLYAAVDNAAQQYKYVSNSWGGTEYSGQNSDDTNFDHPGTVIAFAAGDTANEIIYPSSSPYVVAVGGTTLNQDSSTARGWSESVWDNSTSSATGSGCSQYETQPSWQQQVANITGVCAKRATADVAMDANPNTGLAVYDSNGNSGWIEVGGTSAATPMIAAVYALAGTPGASDNPASYPYAHPGNLYDITTGSNGSCGNALCDAGPGWDGPTGLGTPNGTAAFTADSTPPPPPGSPSVTNPGNETGTVGTAVNLTVHASGGTAPDTWSATGLPAGLSIAAGSGVVSGTPTTAGTSNVTATVTDADGKTGSTSFSWTISGRSSATVTMTNPGGQWDFVGDSGALSISATDSAGNQLTYSASNLPPGLSIDAHTGTISGTITGAGTFHVTVTATDSTGATGNATFAWETYSS